MELGRIGTALALLVLAGAVGAVAAGHPLEALIALPVAAVALQALRRLWGAPLRYAAMAGLILFHFAALWRFSWFDQDIVPLFRPLRAVIGLGMAGLLLPARPRQFIVSPAGAAFILALPYVLWVLVSGQFAPRPARVTFYSLWLLLLVLDTALVCSLFKDPRDLWRSWLIALLIVGALLALVFRRRWLPIARPDPSVGGTRLPVQTRL